MKSELVQQLAERHQGPPPRYVQREGSRPSCPPPAPADVPVIDLRRLLEPDGGGDNEAEKLRFAVQSWGLFQVIGHDILPSFLDELQDAAKKFFQLPVEEKQKYSNLKDGKFQLEGYGNDRVVTEDQILDWNDRLYLLVQPEGLRSLDYWPENPSSFREILHEYTMKTRKITSIILLVLAKLLKLEENYFVNLLDDQAEVFARFTYYPSCPRPDLVVGLKPHSDGSTITILLPDKEVQSLQVLKDGDWEKVPVIPHALLVNLGNQMEIMSNGIFKSPVHRVVASSKERMSVTMFFALAREKMLEPAEGLVDETRPCSYQRMKTKDFLTAFFEKFSQGETTIQWLRIDQN